GGPNPPASAHRPRGAMHATRRRPRSPRRGIPPTAGRRRSTSEAGQRVSQTARDVRGLAEELRKQDREGPARVAEQVADRADRLGDYLQSASGERIVRDVEDRSAEHTSAL